MDNHDRNYAKHQKLKNSGLGSMNSSIKLKKVFADNSKYAERARDLFATPPYYKLINFKRKDSKD